MMKLLNPAGFVIAAILALHGCSEPSQPTATIIHGEPAGEGSIDRLDSRFDSLVGTDALIEKIADGFGFIEGPVWHRGQGHLMFSDVSGNTVYIWDEEDGTRAFIQPVFTGQSEVALMGSNGLNISPQGRLILMEHGARRVSRRERDGTLSTLVDNYQGGRLNSPNDSAYHSSGWLYFTDPPYGLAGGDQDPAKELDFNGVFRLGPQGEIELLAQGQSRPNGIAFSPDESILYVANSDGNQKVWFAYDVLEDGSLGPGRVFYDVTAETEPGSPDGMKVDAYGNLFATGPGGVWVISPDGTHLGTIKPDEVPANVAFGDRGSTLYMTARTGLYRIQLKTLGDIP